MSGNGQLGYSLSIGIKSPVDLAFGKRDKVGTAELITNQRLLMRIHVTISRKKIWPSIYKYASLLKIMA